MEENSEISNVFVVDPDVLGGISITGQPSVFKYKESLSSFREALNNIDYVFAAIIQLHNKKAIENPYPTLAVAFDNSKIDSFDKYADFVFQISTSLSNVTKDLNLPINLLVVDTRDNILRHFKKPTSWIVAIKNQNLYSVSKPWWKFW